MNSIDRFWLTPLDVSLISNEAFCSLTLRWNICWNKSIKLTKNEINDINIILWWAIAREVKLLNNY